MSIASRSKPNAYHFDVNALMEAAEAQTGLSDWGEEDIRRALEFLCYSLNEESRMHTAGAELVRARLSGQLANRLVLMEDRKRYPEIARQEIKRPLIVFGLPRSGTTHMHNLLAAHPGTRAPRLWEMMIPSPPPEQANYESDPRIKILGDAMNQEGFFSEDLQVAHPLHHNRPEESGGILEYAGVGMMAAAMCGLPSYDAVRAHLDFRPVYQFHRKFLQHLQSRNPGIWWVLKSGELHYHLEELFDVHPDACVVFIHRDPGRTIPSIASLSRALRRITTPPQDIHMEGEAWDLLRSYALSMNRMIDLRKRGLYESQILDVHYADLVREPMAVVERIYARFDLPLTEGAQAAMAAYLRANPQNRLGKHRYGLADFGLSEDDIEHYYGRYIDHYGVRREVRE